MIKQNKGKQYNRLPASKRPSNKMGFYCSDKLDGAYVQIHINKEENTVRFFTSGNKEFHLEKAARGFMFAVGNINRNIIILESEYSYGAEGKHGDRKSSARLTTYRTNFAKGIPTVGCSKDTFRVFDMIDLQEPFVQRLLSLRDMRESTNVEFVKHTLRPYGVAFELAQERVLDGWEGLMLKSPDHIYQPGKRTNDVIKLKFPAKMIVTVLRELEGQERLVGMIGSLECLTPEGKTFNVGSGFTDDERNLWGYYEGKHLMIEYESLNNGVPQQPTIKLH